MIDFLNELGNFKQKNFYTSKCKILHFEMSGKNNTTIVTPRVIVHNISIPLLYSTYAFMIFITFASIQASNIHTFTKTYFLFHKRHNKSKYMGLEI